ncbi:MAG TPA: c-type cytochrome domain-containing protein, partial [Acidobacteriota bacterium]|nr:c-type cytochrome domain-containing protein [Acidobacteriota bacterium]
MTSHKRRLIVFSAAFPVFGTVVVFLLLAWGDFDREIDFNAEVRPILNANCTVCHGGVKREAGLSLLFRSDALLPAESGKPAIVPGDSSASEL